MKKSPKHACLVPVLRKCDPGFLPDCRQKMLFKAILYAGEKIFLPGHDPSSQDHDLRIQYIADIGDPCPEDIRHLINCPYTAAVSRFRLFKNPFPVYIGSRQPIM